MTKHGCIAPKDLAAPLYVIVQFASTSKTVSSALVYIKSKARNKLVIEDYMQLEISRAKP